MKSVLISIQPKWCELIANGKKTIEVRKTRPKIETPFKCYIYCTKPKYSHEDFITVNAGTEKAVAFYGGGKVIGEFICDKIEAYEFSGLEADYRVNHEQIDAMCLNYTNLIDYGNGKTLYGWHISDFVIYDEPRELRNFKQGNACPYLTKEWCNLKHYPYHCFRAGKLERCGDYLEKAPQSWCYVKEVK